MADNDGQQDCRQPGWQQRQEHHAGLAGDADLARHAMRNEGQWQNGDAGTKQPGGGKGYHADRRVQPRDDRPSGIAAARPNSDQLCHQHDHVTTAHSKV